MEQKRQSQQFVRNYLFLMRSGGKVADDRTELMMHRHMFHALLKIYLLDWEKIICLDTWHVNVTM